MAPRMTLDHIIKERYPTFVDALRDLDDALSMLFLFANLPSTTYVSPKAIALCQRLCHEFQHYLIVTHSLRKSFLSIKGIYYQATIQGQDILWLVPYKFVQRVSGDIDFRIMATFIDFYTTLLGFVNYRLYTSIGLVYPPKFNKESDEQGAELDAFTLEGKKVGSASPQAAITNGDEENHGNPNQRAISTIAQTEADRLTLATVVNQEDESPPDQPSEEPQPDSNEALDPFHPLPSLGGDVLPQPQFLSNEASTLFADFTFFLSRETPRAPLEFLLKAFGCKRVGWDPVLGDGAYTTDEKDETITHQIVDRPNLPPGAFLELPAITNGDDDDDGQKGAEEDVVLRPEERRRVLGRIYVQPQWVWDCVNQGRLVRSDLYAPGAVLPPHLSPWVKAKRGGYDPTKTVEEQEVEGEREGDEEDEEIESGAEEDEEEVRRVRKDGIAEEVLERNGDMDVGEGMDVAGSEEDEDEQDEEAEGAAFEGFSDEEPAEDEESAAHKSYQAELEAEALGLPMSEAKNEKAKAKSEARKKVEKRRKEEEDDIERRKMMMPNRKRKLFERMEYGNKKREEEAARLRQKRRKLEREGVR